VEKIALNFYYYPRLSYSKRLKAKKKDKVIYFFNFNQIAQLSFIILGFWKYVEIT